MISRGILLMNFKIKELKDPNLVLKEKSLYYDNKTMVVSKDIFKNRTIELVLDEMNINYDSFVYEEGLFKDLVVNPYYSCLILDISLLSEEFNVLRFLTLNTDKLPVIGISYEKLSFGEYEELLDLNLFSILDNVSSNKANLYLNIHNCYKKSNQYTIINNNTTSIDLFLKTLEDRHVENKEDVFNSLDSFLKIFDSDVSLYISEKEDDSLSYISKGNIVDFDKVNSLTVETFNEKRNLEFENYHSFYYSPFQSKKEYVFLLRQSDNNLSFVGERVVNLISTISVLLLERICNEEEDHDYYLNTILSFGNFENKKQIKKDIELFSYICKLFDISKRDKDRIFFQFLFIAINKGKDIKFKEIKENLSMDSNHEKIITLFYEVKEGKIKKEDIVKSLFN
jgi:hypothetical protein